MTKHNIAMTNCDVIHGIVQYTISLYHGRRHIYAIDQDQCAIGRSRGTVICAALTALYTTSVTVNMKVGLENIKQIYYVLFQATSEIMDSSATEIAVFSSGLCPSKNSAIPATSIHNFK